MQSEGARGARGRWALLLSIVGLFFVASFRGTGEPDHSESTERSKEGYPQARTSVVMAFRLQARLEIASASLSAAAYSEAQFHQAFERHARNGAERLLLVAIAGELLGGTAAQERLADLEGEAPRETLELLGRIYKEGNTRGVSDREVTRLQEEMGWFGELAVAYGGEADDTARAALIAKAEKTMAVTVVLFLAGLVGGVGMLVFFFLFCRALYRQRLPRRDLPPPPSEADVVWLDIPILFLGGLLVLGFVGAGPWGVWALPAVLFWPLLRGVPWRSWREGLGLVPGKGLLREVAAGIAGYLALLPFVILALLVSSILVKSTGVYPSHPIIEESVETGSFMSLLLLTCVWAPLFEEAVFRGALLRYLGSRTRGLLAAMTAGLLFAMVHPQGFTVLPVLATTGTVLALLRLWRGTLIAPIAAHALHNGVLMAVLYLLM